MKVLPARHPRSLLIIKTSSLGDVAHTLPAVHAIRELWPETLMSWLVNRELCPLVQALAPIDAVIPFDRESFRRQRIFTAAPWRALWRLRSSFELAIDFQGLFRSALLARFLGARTVIGFSESREGRALYSYTHRTRRKEHPTLRNLELVKALGARNLRSHIDPPRALIAGAAQRLASIACQPDLILAPGARWTSKTLPESSWLALAAELKDRKLRPLILGAKDDAPLADALAEKAAGWSLAAQTSLPELAAIVGSAPLVLGGDSGIVQLAATLGRPCLGIYGPTQWRRTYPLSPGSRVLLRAALSCMGCRHRQCPLPQHHCMTEIPPETIADLVLAMLRGSEDTQRPTIQPAFGVKLSENRLE